MSQMDWEELGWIEVDTAGVAFCREGTSLSERHGELTQVVEDGFVYQSTMEDCPLPVEGRRDNMGQIVAARMCFTNDVDEIEGNWVHIGVLDLHDGRCTACDPSCEGDQYHLALEMMPGRYNASVFEYPMLDGRWDVLGLRITVTEDNEEKDKESSGVG
jgi:hypothetical protein